MEQTQSAVTHTAGHGFRDIPDPPKDQNWRRAKLAMTDCQSVSMASNIRPAEPGYVRRLTASLRRRRDRCDERAPEQKSRRPGVVVSVVEHRGFARPVEDVADHEADGLEVKVRWEIPGA